MAKLNKQTNINYLYIIIGGFIFALGLNLFIVPHQLFSGGIIGISQIIRSIINDYLHISFHNTDIAGIINFLFNVPLFILAYKVISRLFFIKTITAVALETLFMTLIPIPTVLILEDVLASTIVGGLICGLGVGLVLRSGGSSGGVDVLGIYFSKKHPNLSVGQLSIVVNIFVFGVCAIVFSLPTAIYSVIYTVIMSVTYDRIHYQNINMSVMIFTKKDTVKDVILKEMRRGVTYWKGAGAYTNSDTYILMIVISKYELSNLKKILNEEDPQAFVILNEGMGISGNFEKRL